ncbi:protein FAM216A [Mixophyes fleayi]|uniref:protein FAM216A n=1 Tax=Mixophyes fleayi TaxID=3061075 RepID=UPI003F4DB66B
MQFQSVPTNSFKQPELKSKSSFYPSHLKGPYIETFQRMVETELEKLNVNKKRKLNLTKWEREGINQLRENKEVIIKSADKGGGTVLFHRRPEHGGQRGAGLPGNMNACGTKNVGKGNETSQCVPITLQIKTIPITGSMKNATFLKHPDLTMGQKRYLCSIAKIYSTSNMRALTDNRLHSQLSCGCTKTHFKPPPSGSVKHEIRKHCRRPQLDHFRNIEKQEGKSSLEDTTTEAAMTLGEVMNEKITSLS